MIFYLKHKFLKTLITGGAGFIGSHIVDKLLTYNYEVTVIDNLSSGLLKNIYHNQDNENFHFIKGDIRDVNLIKEVVKDQDVIFHQAAITNVSYSFKYPEITNDINIKGILNLLKSCLNSDVKRFIFASSASVYGKKEMLPKKEEMSMDPKSPYAISKAASENYTKLFYEIYGLESIILRYFNVYGPRARKNQGVVSIFIDQLFRNQRPVIYGDGEQTRDFINIYDVADANFLALSSKNAVGETINIGTGVATSINQILNLLLETMNKKHIKPIYSDQRLGDVKHGYADIKKARAVLGFNPKIALKKGIIQLVKSYKNKSLRR